ncbi:hypothetical protein [Nocardioides marmotae]|uniref:Uncharacterized protein n=1 Tax=Nocardioides marmotae TaxID=2663857 RepID=A0A6I3JGR1_9ACTN|nr:hypothetical protein [Nocardioides marmotae]MCR6033602.1 hypothetical protein [Gordonia jinghuaiqii]MBC9733536.1 hypothetical protein [Nocardioides marmotae]MTB84643.1 hypothetical protein [Nocardioides marmotae]MTB97260.1 hypothetical protein [Nocardioides marmotae]QKE01836.1 hypothetical protein HPC71_12735 [Nocardioides marmotae]
MKRTAAVLVALGLALGGMTASASAEGGAKEERVIKRLKGDPEYPDIDGGGKIVGKDGRGIFVYTQIRSCGKGSWKKLERVTTTKTGVYKTLTYRPADMKKFKVKKYDVEFPASVQFRVFIPPTETYKAVRLEDNQCFGG